jgi:hypothetical protein
MRKAFTVRNDIIKIFSNYQKRLDLFFLIEKIALTYKTFKQGQIGIVRQKAYLALRLIQISDNLREGVYDGEHLAKTGRFDR